MERLSAPLRHFKSCSEKMASFPNTVHRCHYSNIIVKGMCIALLTLIITFKNSICQTKNGEIFIS